MTRPAGQRDIDLDPEQQEALGRAIKLQRVARGWERRELADRSGLSYPYLSEIETGKKRPSFGALKAIALALGIRPSELLGAAEWMTSPPSRRRSPPFATPPAPAAGADPATAMAHAALADAHPAAATERADLVREIMDLLHDLPLEDLERLRDLARQLTA